MIKKHLFSTCISVLIFSAVFAQSKRQLAISLSAGKYNTPYYDAAKARSLFGIEADYGIAERHLLSIGFTAGKYDYAGDNDFTNNYYYLHKGREINRKVEDYVFKLVYKYKLLDKKKFAITPGVGAAILVQSEETPLVIVFQGSDGVRRTITGVSSIYSDLVFPVSTDFVYKISKGFQAGVVGGFLIHPDYPIIGLQAGVKISFLVN